MCTSRLNYLEVFNYGLTLAHTAAVAASYSIEVPGRTPRLYALSCSTALGLHREVHKGYFQYHPPPPALSSKMHCLASFILCIFYHHLTSSSGVGEVICI